MLSMTEIKIKEEVKAMERELLEAERQTVSDMAASSALMYWMSLSRFSSSPLPERLRTLCLISRLDMPWMTTWWTTSSL